MSRLGTLVQKVRVLSIGETFQVGANNLNKREMIGRTDGDDYPMEYKLEFIGDQVSKLDDVAVGEFITVTSNVRGNKVIKEGEDDKHFISLQTWKVEKFK